MKMRIKYVKDGVERTTIVDANPDIVMCDPAVIGAELLFK